MSCQLHWGERLFSKWQLHAVLPLGEVLNPSVSLVGKKSNNPITPKTANKRKEREVRGEPALHHIQRPLFLLPPSFRFRFCDDACNPVFRFPSFPFPSCKPSGGHPRANEPIQSIHGDAKSQKCIGKPCSEMGK